MIRESDRTIRERVINLKSYFTFEKPRFILRFLELLCNLNIFCISSIYDIDVFVSIHVGLKTVI